MTLERACPECGHPLEAHFGDLCAGDEDMTAWCRCRRALAPDIDGLEDYDLVTDDVDEAAQADLREWVANRLERIAPETDTERRFSWGDR